MKTIQSIIQAIICNLFPADMAYSLVSIANLILPLLGIVILRIGLYFIIYARIAFSFIRSLHERTPLPPKEVWILKWED